MPEHLLRKHRGKFAVVYYEGSTRIRHSLGTDNPALARTRLGDYIRQIELGKRPESATVGQIVDAYLGQSEAIGLPIMRFHWKAAKPSFGDLRPAHINKAICRDYAIERGRDVKPGTIRKELGIVRNALSWARKEGWVAVVPHIEMPPAPPPRDRRLTREEAEKLKAACDVSHVRLFVAIALGTGARAGAILDLRWSDVDLVKRQVALGGTDRQKARAKVLPLNDTLNAALSEARKGATTPWVIEWGGEPVRSVRKGFAAAAAKAGLRDVTPHVLRHTAATWLAEAGIPMAAIAQYLGHSDSRITERTYARFSPGYLADAARALAG